MNGYACYSTCFQNQRLSFEILLIYKYNSLKGAIRGAKTALHTEGDVDRSLILTIQDRPGFAPGGTGPTLNAIACYNIRHGSSPTSTSDYTSGQGQLPGSTGAARTQAAPWELAAECRAGIRGCKNMLWRITNEA
jgi:hypothetical protein